MMKVALLQARKKSLKQEILKMSFSALAREYANHAGEPNYMNPINKVNKGLRKARPPLIPTETSESYRQQLTFSSLNKHQPQHSSEVRLQQRNTPQENSRTSASKLPPNTSLNYHAVQRRLFKDSWRDDSKENKMSFANVIKKSREKSLKQGDLGKNSSRKWIRPAKNQNGLLTKLKTRLMGGATPSNRPASPSKSPLKGNPKQTIVPSEGQLDMVRISMQSEFKEVLELDMGPSL